MEKLYRIVLWIFMLLYIKNFVMSLTTYMWKKTEGKILVSEVSDGFRSYGIDIEYEYYVNGEKYISNNGRYFGLKFFSEAAAERRRGSYNKGETVSVYYNPWKKSEAVLEKGISLSSFLVLFVLIGALFYDKTD